MPRTFASVDWRDTGSINALPDGTGTAELQVGPVPSGHAWRIARITVTSTSTTETTASVFSGDPSNPANFRDGTRTGNLDCGEYPAPFLLGAEQVLYVVWQGVSAGAQCSASIQYEDLLEIVVADSNQLLKRF